MSEQREQHTPGLLDAEAVRAYAAAKWPQAMQSPLAQAMAGASAMALLESSDADTVIERAEHERLRALALERVEECMNACGGWTVETLSVQIECAVDGELEAEECDEIASFALANSAGSKRTEHEVAA